MKTFLDRYGIDNLDPERTPFLSPAFFANSTGRADLTHRGFEVTDHATPNLPSRDFEATAVFYGRLGFQVAFRDTGWMILEREGIALEFFPHPELDPLTSWFSCCLRLDDLDGFYAQCKAAGIAEAGSGHPRLHPPQAEGWGGTMAALVDRDGTLVRLIQNHRG